MNIFGGILPFIGFRRYYIRKEEFSQGVTQEELGYYLGEEWCSELLAAAEEHGASHICLKTFEAEWFGYVIGKIYKAGVFVPHNG